MPDTVIQPVSDIIELDLEFQRSRTKVDQQTRIARFQLDSDEIYSGNE